MLEVEARAQRGRAQEIDRTADGGAGLHVILQGEAVVGHPVANEADLAGLDERCRGVGGDDQVGDVGQGDRPGLAVEVDQGLGQGGDLAWAQPPTVIASRLSIRVMSRRSATGTGS